MAWHAIHQAVLWPQLEWEERWTFILSMAVILGAYRACLLQLQTGAWCRECNIFTFCPSVYCEIEHLVVKHTCTAKSGQLMSYYPNLPSIAVHQYRFATFRLWCRADEKVTSH
eukprot:scaffold52636_cov45-Prasinocladus_malaysianus.AAC.1